jgi:hypothetical protein
MTGPYSNGRQTGACLWHKLISNWQSAFCNSTLFRPLFPQFMYRHRRTLQDKLMLLTYHILLALKKVTFGRELRSRSFPHKRTRHTVYPIWQLFQRLWCLTLDLPNHNGPSSIHLRYHVVYHYSRRIMLQLPFMVVIIRSLDRILAVVLPRKSLFVKISESANFLCMFREQICMS